MLKPHQTLMNSMHLHHSWKSARTLTDKYKRQILSENISKWLLSGKALSHEANIFMHIKGLLYKHVMDSNQKFLALVIPKS